MQNSLSQEIQSYVESKRGIWSDRSLPVLRSVLVTMAPHWDSPSQCFKELCSRGYTRHSIRTYFLYAVRFEEEVRGTQTYRSFLQKQKAAFKNCYKDKQRSLQTTDYERYLSLFLDTNSNMYNLLVLMGDAGLRVSEALNANWEDIRDGFIWVIGKGNKQRKVPFSGEKLLGKRIGKIVKPVDYRRLFKKHMTPFTPHDFRAFYATNIANHPELNIKDAALLLGHSSIQTTSRYVRSDINRIAQVLSK